jgi:hypothetical protein
MEGNKCINCQQEIQNKFCSYCGQRTIVKRITLREGWNDFWARVYGFDGMFPRTLRDLTIRPGKVAQLFIDGNRAKYYGPVGYFFLMITLFLLILSMLNISFYDFMVKSNQMATIKENSNTEQFIKSFAAWMNENMRWFSFLQIPFIAISSKLFFRKSKLNLLEHSVLPFYILGHVYWISILFSFGFKFGMPRFMILQSIVMYVMFGIGYSQLFDYQSKVKAFIKGVLAQVIGLIFFMTIMALIGFIYIRYIDPSMFEMIKPSNNK